MRTYTKIRELTDAELKEVRKYKLTTERLLRLGIRGYLFNAKGLGYEPEEAIAALIKGTTFTRSKE